MFINESLIGVQELYANDFASKRTVGTASWIATAHQRQGYGTDSRAAMLCFAFHHLGADVALSEYFPRNRSSQP